MALLNLYKATKSLTDLLTLNITRNIDTSLDGGVLQVTAIPPEKVENPSNTLNLFLYHLAEDAYYKNALGPGNDVPNVAKTPMALNLFYVLTSHHEVGDEPQFDAEQQQKLMGYALKTFHDFPVITDKTEIDGTLVLDAELQGNDNSIEMILRPVSAEETIAFWGSEDTRTVRLSAYYEARVILLEPDPPKTFAGTVLNLGAYLVQMGTPQLMQSRSQVPFQLPEINGGTEQVVEASPAQVTLDNSASPAVGHNRLQLLGTNLSAGLSRSLILKNSHWAQLAPPDGPIEQTAVNLDQNPNWQIEYRPDRIEVTLASVLTHVRADETTVGLSVLPGFYSAFVQSVSAERVINSVLKQITTASNEIGFSIAPRINGHDPPDGSGNIAINVGGEFDLLDANLPEAAIQVIVAGEVYEQVASDPPTNAREFWVTNAPNQIVINPHFLSIGLSESVAYPFQLTVNGAGSAPFWIELPP